MKDGKNMRKKLIAAMMAGVLSAGMLSTGVFAADTDLKGEVNTFIAASLSNAMEEIQKDFNETYPDVAILYNADSSGTLQTQIEEGARCDIFFSAADKQMNALVDEDLAKKDTVEDILENKVVLIKPKDGETKVTGFENITDAANIALAGDSVPVGQYAREIFDNLGITDEVNKMEINEGKNVSEVLAAVSEGSNEIGIVYATDAASVADKVDVISEAPADALKTPVLYPVGLIEDKEASEDDTAAAEAFLEYIKSDDAMKVFEKYGFTAYKAEDADASEEDDAEATEEADDTETNAETEITEEAK
jgi:molybdate transport system substrate-binding protein